MSNEDKDYMVVPRARRSNQGAASQAPSKKPASAARPAGAAADGRRKTTGRAPQRPTNVGANGYVRPKLDPKKLAEAKASLNAAREEEARRRKASSSGGRLGTFRFGGEQRPSSGRSRQPRTPRRSQSSSNPVWVRALLAVSAVALLVVLCVGFANFGGYFGFRQRSALLSQDTFYEGITLEGESLAGLTFEQAYNKYKEKYGNIADSTQITINALDKSYTLDSNSVQMSSNIQSTLTLAYSQGRSGSLDERYARIQELKANGLNYSISHTWNDLTLRSRIQEIADDIDVDGHEANVESFDPETGAFRFSEGVVGYKLDTVDLYDQVTAAITSEAVNTVITAKVTITSPKYTAAWLRSHFGRISYAKTTTSGDDNDNRNTNIKLASSQFNGMRVEPGQIVSFNGTVGERLPERGYKPANAWVGGLLIADDGGGVCQVSTTLYNAVAKADLKIVERSNHRHKSGYVPIGLDAAVDWPSQDMKFQNNGEWPVFIAAHYKNNKLEFEVYGKQMDDGVYIMLDSKKTEEIEPPEGIEEVQDGTLEIGVTKTVAAVVGEKAESYKVYYDSNNKEIKRELLAKSTYPAFAEKLRIGTGTNLPTPTPKAR